MTTKVREFRGEIDSLLTKLNDQNPEIRWGAASYLGSVAKARRELLQLITLHLTNAKNWDPNYDVRVRARLSLEEIDRK
jgi:HEAT repeat protein